MIGVFAKHPWLNIEDETLEEIGHRMPQFLIYESRGRKGEKEWQCTACGQRGIDKITGKSGDTARCPVCGEMAELKCNTRLQNHAPSLERWIRAIYFTNRRGTLWAVGCRIYRRFYRNSWDGVDWCVDMDVDPYEVWNFEPGRAREWKREYGVIGETMGTYWYQLPKPREPNTGMFGQHYYSLWQTDRIDATDMKYSRACEVTVLHGTISEGEEYNSVIRYLAAYCMRPKLELVCKWGLTDVAQDYVWRDKTNGKNVKWKANTPWEFLKISKADWKAYRNNMNASVELLTTNRRVFRLPVQKALEISAQLGRPDCWLKNAIAISELGIGLTEQAKYLNRQNQRVMSMQDKLTVWRDYLRMAERVGRDMSQRQSLMPRDLFNAHDEMVEYRRIQIETAYQGRRAEELRGQLQNFKSTMQKYQNRREKLQAKYEYRSGSLMIKVPENGEEIIQEGNVLHICVGGYAGRHLTGATTILFLRRARKPETPYVCIEIRERDNQIIQIHGYQNEFLGNGKSIRRPSERFKPFLDEWLAWVKAGSKRDSKARRKDETA